MKDSQQESPRKTPWKKGVSANPNGRPKGTSKPISGLRKTLNILKQSEDSALDYIHQIVSGKANGNDKDSSFSVDKTRLASSEWVVKMLVELTKAATAEEISRLELRGKSQSLKESLSGQAGASLEDEDEDDEVVFNPFEIIEDD